MRSAKQLRDGSHEVYERRVGYGSISSNSSIRSIRAPAVVKDRLEAVGGQFTPAPLGTDPPTEPQHLQLARTAVRPSNTATPSQSPRCIDNPLEHLCHDSSDEDSGYRFRPRFRLPESGDWRDLIVLFFRALGFLTLKPRLASPRLLYAKQQYFRSKHTPHDAPQGCGVCPRRIIIAGSAVLAISSSRPTSSVEQLGREYVEH
eukprot:3023228-Pyramimonas_sp.AAC.1